jgi:hypothetical protein
MTILIHKEDGVRTIYLYDGYLVQFDELGQKKRMRNSVQTWPDKESAKKSFGDGSVIWGPWTPS